MFLFAVRLACEVVLSLYLFLYFMFISLIGFDLSSFIAFAMIDAFFLHWFSYLSTLYLFHFLNHGSGIRLAWRRYGGGMEEASGLAI